ncbi:MAG: DNA-deoxyinosine glycosylase [Succinivibrio sp.]|nr:DNA-deoxyinosine glycosylase [Succinivibrio sp.]
MNENNSAPLILGLPPFIPPECNTLILGSMPSVASLQQDFYYAYRYNRFWPIIHELSGLSVETVALKKQALTSLRLGLFDVVRSCRRQGSLDQKITDITLNDLENMCHDLLALKRIITNGSLAARLMRRHFPKLEQRYKLINLPSTSPANAQMSYAHLVRLYRQALSDE